MAEGRQARARALERESEARTTTRATKEARAALPMKTSLGDVVERGDVVVVFIVALTGVEECMQEHTIVHVLHDCETEVREAIERNEDEG